ncbi:mercury methylation corrinoid protein HgcA [Thermodesulfobacteriota bacterium B35]
MTITPSASGQLRFLPVARPGAGEVTFRLPSPDQPFVRGTLTTPVGKVPQVRAGLNLRDRLGSWLARWNIGRMHFTVEPGLYALGRPDEHSPVLVSANYKMSFDVLRSALPGRDLWILVLDTKGINVWCAAGKGTFGTLELLDRIQASRLEEVVSHRRLIVPQLGAPGLAAHEIRRHSGFRVIYGPVMASDLPRFLDNGCRAEPGMRVKDFPLSERLVLVPVEVMQALRVGLPLILVLLAVSGLARNLAYGRAVEVHGLPMALAVLAGILAGTVMTPLLLPWIPGRSFSGKGVLTGLVCFAGIFGFLRHRWPEQGLMESMALLLVTLTIASWFAMAFTGATTYTSPGGVRREMLRAIPLQAAALIIGLGLWLTALFS